MSREIALFPLWRRRFSIVDDADYELLNSRRWSGGTPMGSFCSYATTCINGKNVSMPRFLLGVGYGFWIDHINGNGLDNRRINLRVCTQAQNAQNRRKTTLPTSSRFKGVTFNGRSWIAQIAHRYLGSFKSELDAARAYDKASLELFGAFARPNFN